MRSFPYIGVAHSFYVYMLTLFLTSFVRFYGCKNRIVVV